MKLSNVNQPTASNRIVHHGNFTCLNARTLFSPCGHDVLYTCACVFGTHACVNLLLVFNVRSCILYVCLICINYICISYSSMSLC